MAVEMQLVMNNVIISILYISDNYKCLSVALSHEVGLNWCNDV